MKISQYINGNSTLEPFPPGYYEEYEILHDGRTKFLKSVNYHKPGDKPSFQAYIPWSGKYNFLVTSILNVCANVL